MQLAAQASQHDLPVPAGRGIGASRRTQLLAQAGIPPQARERIDEGPGIAGRYHQSAPGRGAIQFRVRGGGGDHRAGAGHDAGELGRQHQILDIGALRQQVYVGQRQQFVEPLARLQRHEAHVRKALRLLFDACARRAVATHQEQQGVVLLELARCIHYQVQSLLLAHVAGIQQHEALGRDSQFAAQRVLARHRPDLFGIHPVRKQGDPVGRDALGGESLHHAPADRRNPIESAHQP